MNTIEITGWRPGFNKVAFTKLLHGRAGMSLAVAKRQTDRLLAGERIALEVPNADAAALTHDLVDVGALAEVHARSRPTPTTIAERR